MQIIDRGSGPPLVLIPGLQGRWEYMRPAVDALSAHFRVVTFSLGTGDLDGYAQQVAAALDEARIDRATICGVSFGGLVAVRFAARHSGRCDALVLASTPRPRLRLRRRHELYLRAPWIFGPLFIAESPWRLRPEICAAILDPRAPYAAERPGVAVPNGRAGAADYVGRRRIRLPAHRCAGAHRHRRWRARPRRAGRRRVRICPAHPERSRRRARAHGPSGIDYPAGCVRRARARFRRRDSPCRCVRFRDPPAVWRRCWMNRPRREASAATGA